MMQLFNHRNYNYQYDGVFHSTLTLKKQHQSSQSSRQSDDDDDENLYHHLPVEIRWWWKRWFDVCVSGTRDLASRWHHRSNPLNVYHQNGTGNEIFQLIDPETRSYRNEMHIVAEAEAEVVDDDNICLVVFIHGLNSSPLSWTRYILNLAGRTDATHYFAPYVYRRGNCSAREAADPIFRAIVKFKQRHPSARICLVGHSIGARIAGYVECLMRSGFQCVSLVSIAGPHGGTRFLTTAADNSDDSDRTCFSCGIATRNWINISPEVRLEYQWNSDSSRDFIRQWQRIDYIGERMTTTRRTTQSSSPSPSTTHHRNRKRLFIATRDDGRVYPLQTSFPRLSNSRFHIMSQQSHVSIIDCDETFNLVNQSINSMI